MVAGSSCFQQAIVRAIEKPLAKSSFKVDDFGVNPFHVNRF
jgi:hypothetical protein